MVAGLIPNHSALPPFPGLWPRFYCLLSLDPVLSSGFALTFFFLDSWSAPGHSYPLVCTLSFPYLPEVWLWLNLVLHAKLFRSDTGTPETSVHQLRLSFAVLLLPLMHAFGTRHPFRLPMWWGSRKMAGAPFWIWIIILKHQKYEEWTLHWIFIAPKIYAGLFFISILNPPHISWFIAGVFHPCQIMKNIRKMLWVLWVLSRFFFSF